MTWNPKSAMTRINNESTIPRITSQNLKTTELLTTEGVDTKNCSMPSKSGFVALCTIFCIKPVDASTITWVSPLCGFSGWIGCSCTSCEFCTVVCSVKERFMTDEIVEAARIMTRPIKAFLIVFFAPSNACGLPEDTI